MYHLYFKTQREEAVAQLLCCCGSVALNGLWYKDRTFRSLMAAILEEDASKIEAAATELVVAAVPEEGVPDPRRATVHPNGCSVAFMTPGGVKIELAPFIDVPNCWGVRVEFGRDSRWLATEMMSSLLITERDPKMKVTIDEKGDGTPNSTETIGRVLARTLLLMDEE